jgi:hypothetical protein
VIIEATAVDSNTSIELFVMCTFEISGIKWQYNFY